MRKRDLAFYVDGLVEGRRGTLVQQQKDRSVWRVEEGGEVWFAKRGVTPKRRREIRRETENARALAAAGFGPRVSASGEHDNAMWMVTEDAGAPIGPALFVTASREPTLHAVAEFIRGLHDAGFATPDLICDHLHCRDGRIFMIDAARLERGAGSAKAHSIARDLGAFLFSANAGVMNVSRVERVRLLREVTGLSGDGLRGLCTRIDHEMDKRRWRTRWRHGYTQMSWDYGFSRETVTGGEVHPSYFDAFISREGMTVVRTLADRENRTLRGLDGALFFVKVFPPTKKGFSPAMREIEAIDLFQRAGILVNRLAAYAEDVDKGSMVAVKAACGEPLDDLLHRGVTPAERRALAVQTARIWRRMRECGLRHRDAYPCHLFAAPWGGGDPLRFELRLIDMTRAGRAPFPKERWFVKDAAALWHGLPRPPVTRTDAVRWLREYFRIAKLDARARRFARRVAAKEARIAARQKRKSKR